MKSRREFVTQAPLGVAALLAACSARDEASGEAIPQGVAAAAVQQPGYAPPAAGPVLNWIPKHEDLCYTFGGVAAKQRIKPGTRIVTWTEDCFDGAVKTEHDLASKVMTPGHDNPQTGPFYIEGAEPGDTVVVHILKLEPARDYGISSFFPGFGALNGTDRTAMLGSDPKETTWRYDLNAQRTVAYAKAKEGNRKWSVPLMPFLGCLGVAPAANETRSTVVPGPFGGNMDCWEVRAGNKVYLGVNAPGALLSFGDGHYAMGEGEIIGTAIEGAMNVEVHVDLIKKSATPVPRIENPNEVMFVGSGRPLEDAARVAFKAMVGWMREHYGLSEMDAYEFVGQAARAHVVQIVDPEYTVLVKVDRARLPYA